MSEHPAPSTLDAFVRGELPPAAARAVTVHLLGGCSGCRARLAPLATLLLAEAPPISQPMVGEGEAGYDAALDRALTEVRRRQWLSARERATVAAVLPAMPKAVASSDSARAQCLRLLERSRSLRHEDPHRMLRAAIGAATIAERLAASANGERGAHDLRALAWVELANALRVVDDLSSSERAMCRAEDARRCGTGDEALLARMLDLKASLRASQRRFDESLSLLDRVRGLHIARGDRHGAGRALVKVGIYLGYDGRPEEAIAHLQEALREIDRGREPELVRSATDGIVHALVDLGRFEEASMLLWRSRPLYSTDRHRQNRRKRRWLEARIHAGLGELDQAEAALTEMCDEFEQDRLHYNAALVSLELGDVLRRRGARAEAEHVIAGAIVAFRELGVWRETKKALAALQLLRN